MAEGLKEDDIQMRNALVTGATKGIGLEIATQLAGHGFRVFLSGRNGPAAQVAAAKIGNAVPLEMDVSDQASIQRVYESVSHDCSLLDVLVNNAGILLDEGESILSAAAEVFTETLRTNTLGPLLVVQTFLPLLAKGSRVINISSEAGAIADGMSSYAPVYSISKTALNAVTCQLSNALSRKGIAVNAVCPGWVRTTMGGMTAPRSVKKGAETPVWLATEALISETGKFWKDKKAIPW